VQDRDDREMGHIGDASHWRCLHLNCLHRALAGTDVTAVHIGWEGNKGESPCQGGGQPSLARLLWQCLETKPSVNSFFLFACLPYAGWKRNMQATSDSFSSIPASPRIIGEALSKSWVTKSAMKFWLAVSSEVMACFPLFCIAPGSQWV